MKRKSFFILTVALLFCCFTALSYAAPFTDNGNGTVTDHKTGLVWQKGEPGPMTWDTALDYCEGLSLGSKTDWRLPNIKELHSLTDDTRYRPAIDRNYFPNAIASGYWSSTTFALNPSNAWVVDFYYGYGYVGNKGNNYYVRCVRGGQCGSFDSLSGYLRDAVTGNPLSGVTITVDGASDTTDANGYYSIPEVSCGAHQISVNVPSGYSGYNYIVNLSGPAWDIYLTKPGTVYGPQAPSGYSADPVNTATGNYIYQRTDLEIPGKGTPLVFERNYNSQDDTDGPLGFGWNHSYNSVLTVNADSTVTIRWGDGRTETWTPDGGGGYTPQYGVFDTLIDNGDGTFTLRKKDLTVYNFNTSGKLSGIVDKNLNTLSLTYSAGNLALVSDTSGRNISFTYDANNRITTITDPMGRTVQFAYDVDGNLTSSTDMNGNVTAFTYDTQHQVLAVVDPRGNTLVSNTYDALKRVVTSQSDAKGGVTSYTYDEVNKKTTIVDQLGYTTIHYHDSLLRLIQETDHLGNSAYYTYDSAGNRTEVKDKNGNSTTYAYDSSGNVISKTDALGNVTTITYDANNNPLTRTDALGNTTTFEYDANGNLIKTTDALGNFTTVTYNANGLPLVITDALGNAATNVYDTMGNLTSGTDALGNITAYTYDGAGRRLTATNPLGNTTTNTYDNNNNPLSVTDPLGGVTAYTYDGNNNRLTTTDSNGNTTSYSYDVKDLLQTITDPAGSTITNGYDGLDRKTSVTDKNGNTSAYAYDAVGNLVSITDALGNVTQVTYDAKGNKLTEINALGNTATYTYDALDRVTAVTDPLGNTSINIYDTIGRITASTNAKGQTASYQYDVLGRLTSVTDFAGGTVVYTYDANGNRTSMTDPNGNTTTYAYDALSRLLQKVEPLSVYLYAYDANGNMSSATDAKGQTINYSHDAGNRLDTVTYPDASTVHYIYDANGNRLSMTDSSGTSTYVYDSLNRMTSYVNAFGMTAGYGYDPSGSRTAITYPDGKSVTYTYDALNRLLTVTDWLARTTNYTYDAAGNLTGGVYPNSTTTSYSYDDAGRLTGLVNLKPDSSIISEYAYSLDAIGNQMYVSVNEPLLPALTARSTANIHDAENRLVNEGGAVISYDANGSMTSRGGGSFTYDYEDRLIQSNIGGIITQYGYDGDGSRLSVTINGTTVRYAHDVNAKLTNVIAESNAAGTITAYYVYGLGLISKVLPDGTTHYYHYDSRGSTIALSDNSGNLTDKYAYDSFGNVVNSEGSTANPYLYLGSHGVMDEGNGLNYIRARYYAADMGRFITKDPLTGNDRDSQSLNRYVYALNNPVMYIDADGEVAQWVIGAGLGAAWGAGSTLIGDLATSAIIGEWKFSSKETYAGNTIGGIAGGMMMVTVPGCMSCARAAQGAVSNATTQALEIASDKNKTWRDFDYSAVGRDAVISVAVGAIADKVSPKLPRQVGRPANEFMTKYVNGKNIVTNHLQKVLDITTGNIIKEVHESLSYKYQTYKK